MSSLLEHRDKPGPGAPDGRTDGFRVVQTDRNPGRNAPQRMGARLWAPMFVLALAGFGGGLAVGFIRAAQVAAGADAVILARLQHVGAGLMFIGFLGALSAIVFAIARILGELRAGGGTIQEIVGSPVQTLRMPGAAKGMLALMMIGMMLLVVAIAGHFVVASGLVGADASALASSTQQLTVLEGIRRTGVGLYLFAITLGLATIVHVLHFQSVRLHEIVQSREPTS